MIYCVVILHNIIHYMIAYLLSDEGLDHSELTILPHAVAGLFEYVHAHDQPDFSISVGLSKFTFKGRKYCSLKEINVLNIF
jgi:hypothetical protein